MRFNFKINFRVIFQLERAVTSRRTEQKLAETEARLESSQARHRQSTHPSTYRHPPNQRSRPNLHKSSSSRSGHQGSVADACRRITATAELIKPDMMDELMTSEKPPESRSEQTITSDSAPVAESRTRQQPGSADTRRPLRLNEESRRLLEQTIANQRSRISRTDDDSDQSPQVTQLLDRLVSDTQVLSS